MVFWVSSCSDTQPSEMDNYTTEIINDIRPQLVLWGVYDSRYNAMADTLENHGIKVLYFYPQKQE